VKIRPENELKPKFKLLYDLSGMEHEFSGEISKIPILKLKSNVMTQ
jgi:hypothetical protein